MYISAVSSSANAIPIIFKQENTQKTYVALIRTSNSAVNNNTTKFVVRYEKITD